MSVYHVRGAHVRLIAAQYAKNSLRNGTGIIFTFLALTVGLVIAAVVLTPVEYLQKALKQEREARDRVDRDVPPELRDDPILKKLRGLNEEEQTKVLVQEYAKKAKEPIKWGLGTDDEQVDYLVDKKPALVSAILVILIWALPFLVVFGAFNQMAGDIQYKGLRYLLLRTERINIFLGRFVGTLIFTMVVLLILLVTVFFYIVFKMKFYPASDVAIWVLQGWFAIAILALPYIALCAWFSAVNDGPFVALVIILLIVGGVPLFVWIGSKSFEQFQYAGYVMPWPLKFNLLHPNPGIFFASIVGLVAQTIVYLGLGMASFQKRDL